MMATKNTNEGIVFLGVDDPQMKRAKLAGYQIQQADKPCTPFKHTLIVRAGTYIPFDKIDIGFKLLGKWQMAVPMASYGDLAYLHGSDSEQRELKKVIGDLRVIPYHPDFVFIRQDMQHVLEEWNNYEGDAALGLLRAVFIHKPMVNVLPVSWLRSLQFKSNQFLSSHGINTRRKHDTQFVKIPLGDGSFVKVAKGKEQSTMDMLKGRETMPVVKASNTWPVVTEATRRNKGTLIRVTLPSGNMVKMYEQDAIAQGLIEPEIEPQEVESEEPAQEDQEVPEAAQNADFAAIKGIGKASAKKLVANGILTHDDLLTKNIDFLPSKVVKSIEAWRDGIHNTD